MYQQGCIMSLVSLFYKVRAVIGRIILRRKKIHKIDFPHLNEHMRRDLGYYNGDGAHRVHDRDLRAHHPFNRGP